MPARISYQSDTLGARAANEEISHFNIRIKTRNSRVKSPQNAYAARINYTPSDFHAKLKRTLIQSSTTFAQALTFACAAARS